jgi:hypothetical protein
MDTELLRRIIRNKLAKGGLPNDSIPRMCGRPTAGETCDGCDEIVTKPQMLMEGTNDAGRSIKLHVHCFYIWDNERRAVGHEPSAPSGSAR